MIHRICGMALAGLLLSMLGTSSAAAQTTAIRGVYLAGWNMVGGPPGADFSAAAAIDAYGPNGYVAGSVSPAQPCQGYWADFVNPATVALPYSTGPIQNCPLHAGWNLVGNPFSGNALLPPGFDGYHWNPDVSSYDIGQLISPGGADWIYATSATNLVLQYAGAVTGSPVTVEIDFVSPGPYIVHVGDSVKLLLPAATPYTATTDSSFLHLESAGTSGSLTCVGSGCQLQTDNRFWIWHAFRPGTTAIAISPQCATAVPPCLAPSLEIAIIILP